MITILKAERAYIIKDDSACVYHVVSRPYTGPTHVGMKIVEIKDVWTACVTLKEIGYNEI